MAFIGKITAPLKKAIMKVGRKNSAENKTITKAYEASDYTSRKKFVSDVESAIVSGEKKTSKKIKKKETKTETPVKRTRKEEAELKSLIDQQEKDIEAHKEGKLGSTGKGAGGRQQQTIKKPGSRKGKRKVADPRNRLRSGDEFSKAEIANMTYDEVQDFIDKGIGGSALVNANRMRNNVTKAQLDEVEGLVKGGELSIAKKHGQLIGKKPDWMKGLSEDRIKEILGGPHPSGKRRTNLKKKEKPVQTAWSLKYSKKKPPRSPKPSRKVRGKGYGGITPVKKIFRRGGGQALRGFGKATYSNKLY